MDKKLEKFATSFRVSLLIIPWIVFLMMNSYRENKNEYYKDEETEDYITELETKIDWYEKELARLYSEQNIDISNYSVD